LDLGGTTLTGMRPLCHERLKSFLGFEGPTERIHHGIDERILEWAGTDFRSVGAIVDLPSSHTRILSPVEHVDCWGVRRKVVGGEWQIVESPLRGAPQEALATYPWPEARVDEEQLLQWEAEARALERQGDYVVVAEHPVLGILELGCWLCGYDDFLERMAADQGFVQCFFDRILEIQLAVVEQYYSVLGPYIQLTTSGDDFGSQNGPFISPAMFDELVAPAFSARIERTKQVGRCLYWHHTCGSVFRLMESIIRCGVDILNPVQTSAAEMEPARLKTRFGSDLVFWGGVDVQGFLPRVGTDEVKEGIRELIRTLGKEGGYVMAPAHEMQDDIPPENIAVWVEEAKQGLSDEGYGVVQ